jgi:hypothetical protein
MKKIWEAFQEGIGRTIAQSLCYTLLAGLWVVLAWVCHKENSLTEHGKEMLTIFLFGLSLALLILLILSRISYARFRMKVYKKEITPADLLKEENKHLRWRLKHEVLSFQEQFELNKRLMHNNFQQFDKLFPPK